MINSKNVFSALIFCFCKNASAGNRTRVNCLEGSYAHHYTTDASIQGRYQTGIIFGKSRVKVKSLFKMSLP